MKILIISPRLCHGGAERVAVTLAKGFIQRGHQIVFLTDLFEEQTYQLDEGIILQNLVDTPHPKWKKWISAIKNVRRLIRKNRPDAIIGIMPLCSIVARFSTIGIGIPVIATEHNSYERPHGVKFSFFEKLYKFYLTRLFPVVTVLTEVDKQLLNNKDNVVVMPNPLVLEPIKTIMQRENVILAAGRVDNWHVKGFDVLIRAWGRIVKSEKLIVNRDRWKLQIAGVWRNPETRKYLDGIAEECGVLDKIEYLGFVEDMQDLYAESSIFVLSSRYEGFGLVLIEAMSQGCACIACDYKGRQKEILCPDGDVPSEKCQVKSEKFIGSNIEICENGILCEPDSVDALAEAMKTMIIENEYRESVRQNAINRSEYYSIEHTMDRWESLLNNIIK